MFNTDYYWKLILILWPSWVWKWTLISMLKERRKDFFYPVSLTTREIREWEKDWETYYFVSIDDFEQKIKNGDFLEYAFVHNKAYYWMLKKPILDAIDLWKIVIREVDVQWFDSIRKQFDHNNLASIFILPPTEEILIRRIKKRSEISNEEINSRLESLKKELEYVKYVDFTVENIDYGQEEMYKDLVRKIELIWSQRQK